VLDGNNSPVSPATVSLTRHKPLQSPAQARDKGQMKVVTDARGRFKFEKLYNEGYYDVSVEAAQYGRGIFPLVPVNSDRAVCQVGVGGESSGKTLLIDRPTTEISVLVKATAVIKGTTYTQEAKSNGKGQFTFNKLPYGSYALDVNDGKFISEPSAAVPCEREK